MLWRTSRSTTLLRWSGLRCVRTHSEVIREKADETVVSAIADEIDGEIKSEKEDINVLNVDGNQGTSKDTDVTDEREPEHQQPAVSSSSEAEATATATAPATDRKRYSIRELLKFEAENAAQLSQNEDGEDG